MTLPPITIPLLDPAGPIDPDNDLMLIRQGLNDRKIPAGSLLTPRLGGLPMLPGQLIASDVLLIGRNNGSGYDNYIMPPQYLGFLNNTTMWFWQSSAPLGWTVVPNSGDKVLATILPGGASYKYNAFGYQGTWQQADHYLTIDEMPAHTHDIATGHSGTTGLALFRSKVGTPVLQTESEGGNGPHNHGLLWRPSAAVGILCVKDKQVGQ